MFGGKAKVKDLDARIAELERDNQLLRSKLRLLAGAQGEGTLSMSNLSGAHGAERSGSGTRQQQSIIGLDVGYMVVNRQSQVTQMNSRMARFLGCEKNVTAGKPLLADFDRFDWAPAVLSTLIQDCQLAGDNVPSEFEATKPTGENGKPEHYHFKAIWTGDIGTITIEDITQLKTTRDFFERLVSPQIVTQLLDSGENPFNVEKRQMTVMFGDMRNFTYFCDHVPPENVHTVFDEFLRLCIDAIDANGATLDKFVGDQVMALFAAPIFAPGHAYQAIKVAVQVQRSMRRARASWVERGLIPGELLKSHPNILKLGAGINTGEMIVGMFGAERTNQYTALGHAVNMAARLCSNAAGNEILVGMQTLEAVKAYYGTSPSAFDLAVKFKSRGEIAVKGMADPVPVAMVEYEEAG